jgi:hypothetical protein
MQVIGASISIAAAILQYEKAPFGCDSFIGDKSANSSDTGCPTSKQWKSIRKYL